MLPAFKGVMQQASLPTQEMPPSRPAGLGQELSEFTIVRTRAEGAQPHKASSSGSVAARLAPRKRHLMRIAKGHSASWCGGCGTGSWGALAPRPLDDGLPSIHNGLALLLHPHLPVPLFKGLRRSLPGT